MMQLRTPLAATFFMLSIATSASAQNLVDNAAFDDDLSGWTVNEGSWSSDDAAGNAASGSFEVTVTQGSDGASICVPVSGGQSYVTGLDVKLDFSSGNTRGTGGLLLTWMADANCSSPLAAYRPDLSAPFESDWHELQLTLQAPGNANSALIELVATKTSGSGSVTLGVDNVLFEAEGASNTTTTTLGGNTTTTLDGNTTTTLDGNTTTTLDGNTTTTLPDETTTTTLQSAEPSCGDLVAPFGQVTMRDAHAILKASVGRHRQQCDLCICDVNGSGGLTVRDALQVIKYVIGRFDIELDCGCE